MLRTESICPRCFTVHEVGVCPASAGIRPMVKATLHIPQAFMASGTELSQQPAGDFIPANPARLNPPPAFGWTCPRCGRGNAPSNSTCPCLPLGIGPVTC